MNTKPPLAIAIIGAGDWAGRMHLPALRKLSADGRLTCVGVCDLRADAARAFADALGGAQAFSDVETMLRSCRPEAVAVLVSPPATPGVLERVIARRVPFLVEKPPASDAATHRRLIEAAGELTHVVAYNRRHAPYVVAAREWLQGERPQSVLAQFSRHRRADADFSTTAVHAIDTVLHLAGGPPDELRIDVAIAHDSQPGAAGPHSQPGAAGPHIRNFFLAGWAGGVRIDLLITPDTASASEHYTIRGRQRSAVVAFPHNGTIDLPGCVELHEGNRVARRLDPADFGIAPDDQPALCGIVGEHELLCRAVCERVTVESTLAGTLATQRVRDELNRLVARGGRQSADVKFGRGSNPRERGTADERG